MSSPAYFDQPFAVDGRGRGALTNVDDHVRDLIIAVLFTNPGERVNVPDFGCGLRQLIFAPNSALLATATESLAASALSRWLADWIIVDTIAVTVVDNMLTVELNYRRRDTQEPQQLVVSRS
jgi:phage baseplate assembly protein W